MPVKMATARLSGYRLPPSVGASALGRLLSTTNDSYILLLYDSISYLSVITYFIFWSYPPVITQPRGAFE